MVFQGTLYRYGAVALNHVAVGSTPTPEAYGGALTRANSSKFCPKGMQSKGLQ